jgi:hypothetical protein
MSRVSALPESKSEEVGGNGQPWLKDFLQSSGCYRRCMMLVCPQAVHSCTELVNTYVLASWLRLLQRVVRTQKKMFDEYREIPPFYDFLHIPPNLT